MNWIVLKAACRECFARSQHGRWRQERDLYTLRQQPRQTVASFTANMMKAACGLEMSQAQIVRVVLRGLHPTVTPFVEQLQPATVDELLRCPAAINGMSAPMKPTEQITSVASFIEKRLVERMNDVMAYATHDGRPMGQRAAERNGSCHMTRVGDYGPGSQGQQSYGGLPAHQHSPAERGYSYWENRPAARRNQGQQHYGYRNDRCPQCGRWCAGDRNCPVYLKSCFGCQQVGHFVAQCRHSRI